MGKMPVYSSYAHAPPNPKALSPPPPYQDNPWAFFFGKCDIFSSILFWSLLHKVKCGHDHHV